MRSSEVIFCLLGSIIHIVVHAIWSFGRTNDMEISQATLTISILMLSLLLGMLIFMKPRKKAAPLPPGPRGLPIVGYLPFLSLNILNKFKELASHYGPIYKLQVGSRLWIVVSSPSVAKEVTRDQDMIFANHVSTVALEIFSHGGHDITFSPYGSHWRLVRKIFVRELLSKSSLDATYDLRKDEVRNSIKLLSAKVGTTVDIGELMFTTKANATMSMVWGRTIEADEQSKVGAEIRTLLRKCLELAGKQNVSDIFPVIARFDLQGVAKEMKAVVQSFDEILETIIHKSMRRVSAEEGNESKEGKTKTDFIQILLELGEQEETGTRISTTQIKSILLELVFGGPDTVATAARWVMTELVHNTRVMQKVQRELDDVVGVNQIVEEFHVPKLQYLNAVVKEGLRLHPPLPYLIPRFPSQSCTLAGYTIPKNTTIFVNVWAIQRDPQLWDNPLDFKPERFLDEPDKWDLRGNNFEYLPFGSGRRICAGLSLAERLLMYTLASLLHSFDWQATETKDVDLSEKTKSLLAIPTKRLPDSDLYA